MYLTRRGLFLLRENLHPALELRSEVSHEPLDGPRRSVGQRTDRMTLDLLAQLPNHVNLRRLRVSVYEPEHTHKETIYETKIPAVNNNYYLYIIFFIQSIPSRHGVHCPHDSCL